jgi:hypothetical protein
MQSKAQTVEEYLRNLPDDRKEAMNKLRVTILENIPKGFVEEISYGMIGYVVPRTLYPDGYHCNPKLPLPFINLASQKNFIALYHMGIYANPELLKWFTEEFSKHSNQKWTWAKVAYDSKKMDQIPFDLIAELVRKMSVEDWVNTYESQFSKSK